MKFKEKLREIVEGNSTQNGRYFDYGIQLVIIISLTSFALETLPNNSEWFNIILQHIETITVIIFTGEYFLRIYVAKNRLKYMLSFYGIIDLISIIPFYIARTLDLRALRIFRIFRVFKTLKLIRYSKAISRFHLAAKIIKEEFILFLIIVAIFIFMAASGIYFFEHEAQPEIFKSVFHSLWWAIVTLSTVGYGDAYPITAGGKIFTFFILLIGVGVVTIPAGLVASALSKARQIEEQKNKQDKQSK